MPSASSRSLARPLIWLGALVSIAGCTRFESHGAPATFRLTHVRPSNADGLFLNEEIVFYFSDEIEPTSVTSASLLIRSEQGVPARGRLEVGVDSIRFVPAPVLASDLSDGGFLPGTRYEATLAGFPRPEGLRSKGGALLEKTWTWAFETVGVTRPRESLVFEDRFQDHVGILRLFPAARRQGTTIGSRDSIHLACDKPLDPSTVLPAAFRLVRVRKPKEPKEPKEPPLGIRVQVLENHPTPVQGPRPAGARSSGPPQDWEREPRACVIEVTPEVPLVQTESYMLTVDSRSAGALGLLRDFSGNPVLADPSQEWGISVKEMAGDRGRSELREEFDSSLLRSGVALPGYDGTAAWRESGRVAIRFPSAAGSGGDGQVVLSEREDRTDIQAVSLDLPEGATCRLRAAPGLVVLRCQGRMSIRGQLIRDVPWDPTRELERDPTLAAWSKWSRARRNPFEDVPVPTPWVLSEWLAATRAGDLNWTVLIAGGDLSIEGEFRCSNPVLLVAGGSIRVSGSVRGVDAPELGLGGVFLPPDTGAGGEVWPEMKASLVVDEPTGRNPLVERLRFAVISSPVPPSGDVLRWLPARIGGSPRDERWRVRFVPEFASAPRRPEDIAAVDEPDLIATPGPIRFLIELDVPPSDVWDPPWVDFVHLAWERTPRSPFGGR